MPRGRVVEIFGPESSGKTTLALQVIAQAQKLGGMAAFVDAEHALDATYARKLGVDIDNLLVSQPDNGEQALEIAEVLVRSGGVDVVVVDSVAALVPRAEIEGEMGEAQMGLQARLMSQALRKLTGVVSKSKTCLVFINQMREKIGVMFGNPETTTGGRALKFYASVRMDIRRIASIKDGDVIIGGRTRVKVVKNKVAPPFREAEFDILYGEGISREGDLLDLAVDRKIVDKSGTWFAYSGERLGQGRENAKQFLRDNPETTQAIEDRAAQGTRSHARGDSAGVMELSVLAWLAAHRTPWLDSVMLALTNVGRGGTVWAVAAVVRGPCIAGSRWLRARWSSPSRWPGSSRTRCSSRSLPAHAPSLRARPSGRSATNIPPAARSRRATPRRLSPARTPSPPCGRPRAPFAGRWPRSSRSLAPTSACTTPRISSAAPSSAG